MLHIKYSDIESVEVVQGWLRRQEWLRRFLAMSEMGVVISLQAGAPRLSRVSFSRSVELPFEPKEGQRFVAELSSRLGHS
jgi:hypothetical protein